MSFFLIQANAIVRETSSIPETYEYPDGTTVMGYDLRTDLHQADGWLPGVLVGPVPTLLQTGTRVRTIFADRVEESWTNIVANTTAVNRKAIEDALDAAIAQITSDLTSLTGILGVFQAMSTATVSNVAAAQTQIRSVGTQMSNLLPALNRLALTVKRLVRLQRALLDASD